MTTWEAWHLRSSDLPALVSEPSSYLTFAAKGYESIRRKVAPIVAVTRFDSGRSGHARVQADSTRANAQSTRNLNLTGKASRFVADYKNGKQKRTKTRKEKTEET
jgi:hypothetical protein